MGAKFGHQVSIETRVKISDSLKGKYVGVMNPFYGQRHSKETIDKIKIARSKQISPMKGRRHTYKARLLNSLAHRKEKHPRWNGGINLLNENSRKSPEYKLWRKQVFERDDYTCQECGARSGDGITVILRADHIKPFALYPELRFNLNNGRTLCDSCHRKTDTFGWRKIYSSVRLIELTHLNKQTINKI